MRLVEDIVEGVLEKMNLSQDEYNEIVRQKQEEKLDGDLCVNGLDGRFTCTVCLNMVQNPVRCVGCQGVWC